MNGAMNSNRLPIYLMPMLLLLAALMQSTVTVRLELWGVKPDLVLLLVVIGALIYGSKAALGWGFLGGIGVDLFSGGPLGISSMGLMSVALVAGIGHRILSRYHLLVPVSAGAVGTLLYGLVYIGLLTLLREIAAQSTIFGELALPNYQLPFWPTLQDVIVPATFYNTLIILLVTPLLNRIPEIQEA
jgi:rod shape-determining protein MreD